MIPDPDPRHDPDTAPETDNSEQEDEDAQAQTVADEALGRDSRGDDAMDSKKVNTGDDSDDVPDLIDRMKQMESSGIIDMGAFRGEPNDDDEEDRYGADGDNDD